jgi:hypothetical protein
MDRQQRKNCLSHVSHYILMRDILLPIYFSILTSVTPISRIANPFDIFIYANVTENDAGTYVVAKF